MSTTALAMVVDPEGSGTQPHWRLGDPDAPQLQVTSPGLARGDGVFETVALRNGVLQSEQRHLDRFTASAARLDLPTPAHDVWREACRAVVAELDDPADYVVKYAMLRGDEQSSAVGWVHAAPAPDYDRERAEGIGVVVLGRGFHSTIPAHSAWLLHGAKTMSYAVNMAALREAKRRGADDAIFVSADGLLLEGPTSSVVVLVGDTLVTPHPTYGVIEGTTQADVFAFAEEMGLETEVRDVGINEVTCAPAVWLMSSVRLAVPVRSIKNISRHVDFELTAEMNRRLMARTS